MYLVYGAGTVANALSLPFPDATFDRVIAAEVLEHIPPDRAAMTEEIHRCVDAFVASRAAVLQ